ncbi:MAG: SGNH/GDSL hydrolase family protein [Ruminococcaceae bacterium]|nr:SGNH/GDSL hydrolase family protein [Oscillospiraceae bacterium]
MLNNTVYKLTKEKDLTVGYFGGSITEGAGASDPSKCWRSLTTEWLREKYPHSTINEINAAIGGTGSDLGVFRCERDLLSGKPDLVFFEFSCNDFEDSFLPLVNNCESIFRKIWLANPFCDIVVVYTMIQSMDDFMGDANVVESRTAHGAVAFYYGDVLQIDMGEVLRRETAKAGGDWNTYTVDTVHPNDEGYGIYASVVQEKLEKILSEPCNEPVARVLPSPLFGDSSYVGAHLEDSRNAEYTGDWTFVESSLCGRYPHFYQSETPGAQLTFKFFGIKLGIYWMMAKDSGNIEYSVDGGEWKSASSWDFYCKNFDRAHRMMLTDDMKRGEHILRLRVSSIKDQESEGYAIRIGAFLVCG